MQPREDDREASRSPPTANKENTRTGARLSTHGRIRAYARDMHTCTPQLGTRHRHLCGRFRTDDCVPTHTGQTTSRTRAYFSSVTLPRYGCTCTFLYELHDRLDVTLQPRDQGMQHRGRSRPPVVVDEGRTQRAHEPTYPEHGIPIDGRLSHSTCRFPTGHLHRLRPGLHTKHVTARRTRNQATSDQNESNTKKCTPVARCRACVSAG